MKRDIAWEIVESAHVLRRFFDRRVASLGITRAQWRALMILAREPDQRQVDLAERLEIEPITLCRIIDRLEESGLVERRRDPADRRAWRLALTAKAEPLIKSLRTLADEVSVEAFADLGDEEIETLRATLDRIRNNVAAATEEMRKAS